MAVSGGGLVLFLLFHGAMNVVSIFSEDGYRWICQFLGANWYALVGTMGLAVLMVFHLIYAFILSLENYMARGRQRYAVNERPDGVSWASKNMLAIGAFVLFGLVFHLVDFWLWKISGVQFYRVLQLPKVKRSILKRHFQKLRGFQKRKKMC